MSPVNLNYLGGDEHPPQRDNGCVSGPSEVVFRDHQRRLLALFREAKERGWVCFGAVAWLTDPKVLKAMATIPTSVLVQKEDFLRPDPCGDREGWKADLQEQYLAIGRTDELIDERMGFQRHHMPDPLCDMSSCGDPQISGVRCFGVGNDRRRTGQQPLMHNKCLVFAQGILEVEPGHEDEEDPPGEIVWKAQVVWTGSCNLSRLAPRSRENAVIIRDPGIADAYVSEWSQMMALSEPLNWTAEWVEPEWRIGS